MRPAWYDLIKSSMELRRVVARAPGVVPWNRKPRLETERMNVLFRVTGNAATFPKNFIQSSDCWNKYISTFDV